MNVKDIHRWESCRLEDRKTELPRSSGVYAVINKNRVMYVGRSGNLNKRWRSGHHRYLQAAKLKDPRIAWLCADKGQIGPIENYFIKQYQPSWNGSKVQKVPPTWIVVWKFRMIALLLAAIAGVIVGLLTLPSISPDPNYSEPNPSESQKLNQ